MRRLINRFKEPIYKKDLFNVIGYGLLNTILFSILAGAIQFALNTYLGVGFGILIYLIAYMIAKLTSDKIFNQHILYTTIAIIFFIIGIVIYNISYYSFIFHDVLIAVKGIFSLDGIFYYVFPFLNYKTYIGINILYNILDIIIVIMGIMTIKRFFESKR